MINSIKNRYYDFVGFGTIKDRILPSFDSLKKMGKAFLNTLTFFAIAIPALPIALSLLARREIAMLKKDENLTFFDRFAKNVTISNIGTSILLMPYIYHQKNKIECAAAKFNHPPIEEYSDSDSDTDESVNSIATTDVDSD